MSVSRTAPGRGSNDKVLGSIGVGEVAGQTTPEQLRSARITVAEAEGYDAAGTREMLDCLGLLDDRLLDVSLLKSADNSAVFNKPTPRAGARGA